jgi:hypothetical protein
MRISMASMLNSSRPKISNRKLYHSTNTMKKPSESEFQAVSSSIMESYAHKEDERELYIKFHNGRVYGYSGVTKTEVDAMLNSESIGRYFKANIEKNHPYVQL